MSICLLCICLALNIALFGQEQIYERVEVVNQEILVRVFSGRKPVSGLGSADFTLFEDGSKVKINYCRELRRSLAGKVVPATSAQTEANRQRLFLFMLWFNEESKEWSRAWDYFVTHIYRSGDRIILSDGTRALEILSLEKDKEKLTTFFTEVGDAMKQKKFHKARLVSEMENKASDFYDNLVAGLIDPKLLLEGFKVHYLGALNEYRLARLKGYPRWLERLAGSLKAVEAEKWVLIFMQNERLPLLSREGRLATRVPGGIKNEFERFMKESERQITLGSDVIGYFRDLQPLFLGANATYHLFLSDAAGETLPGEHYQWQPVFSSWEGTFRQISADTGGRVSNTTNLDTALEKAAANEDIYYVLTYLPAEGKDRKRDLKVEVNRPGMKAVYSRKLTLAEIFPLKIPWLDWQEGLLKISLSDYQRLYGEAGLAGRLRVGVQAEAKGTKPLAFEKEILPIEAAVTVEMAMNFPAPGHYRIKVDVEDLLSNHRVRAEKEIEILPVPPPVEKHTEAIAVETAPSAELAALLDLAAGYCRGLKEEAFRFYCLERVEEKVLERNPQNKQVEKVERRWRYDYQIVGAGGDIKEQRRLFQNAGLKVGAQSVPLETRFSSRYSVFMPVTLLALENQMKYRYKLVERGKLKKRRCAVVEVLPWDPESGEIAQGKVWIDEADGSVLKIEMSPRGVAGIQALQEAAGKMSARLALAVTHWYLVRHQGLRFPSETEFVETYEFDKSVSQRVKYLGFSDIHHGSQVEVALSQPYMETRQRQVEFYNLRQVYEKYRFFQVESREEIKDPQ